MPELRKARRAVLGEIPGKAEEGGESQEGPGLPGAGEILLQIDFPDAYRFDQEGRDLLQIAKRNQTGLLRLSSRLS